MNVRRNTAIPLVMIGALAGSLMFGCDGKGDAGDRAAALAAFQPQLGTPREAVRSLLEFLNIELDLRPRDGTELFDTCTARAMEFVDADGMLARYRGNSVREMDREVIVGQVVGNWAALVSYYRDGFDADQMVVPEPTDDMLAVTAAIPAKAGDSEAVLRIDLTRKAASLPEWRVARVYWEPTVAVIQPAGPSPTTAPTVNPGTATDAPSEPVGDP